MQSVTIVSYISQIITTTTLYCTVLSVISINNISPITYNKLYYTRLSVINVNYISPIKPTLTLYCTRLSVITVNYISPIKTMIKRP